MAITEEGLLRVMTTAIAQAVAQTLEATRSASSGTSERRVTKDLHKFYTRLDKYGSDESKWKEWYYQFSVATNAYDERAAQLMEEIEAMELTEVSTSEVRLGLEQQQENWMEGTKAELFSALCLLTTGEANMLIRSCADKNGYTAWKKLYDRFNPKTPASLTAAWREVVRPKKVKDMREAGKAIDAWEEKVAVLKKEHSEEPTVGLKASLLLEMLPDSVQMTVAQGMSSKKLDYETLKAKIKMMANVQIDYTTPKPMEIGELRDNSEHSWEDDEADYDVDALGAITCHRCGGVGHYARECGTAKGKGKDGTRGKGLSKGKGKDGGKGKGKESGKGKGKGCYNCGGNHFARECPQGGGALKGGGKASRGCFTCGGYGHRAAECPTAVRAVEQEDEEDSDRNIGNMWLCDVRSSNGGRVASGGADVCRSKKFQHHTVDDRPSGKLQHYAVDVRSGKLQLETSNRFEGLREASVVPVQSGRPQVGSVTSGDQGSGRSKQERWIQSLDKEEIWKEAGTAEITIDSAADESVCPWDWGKAFRTKEVPEQRRMKFRNASGGRMEHYGEKRVTFVTNDQDKVIGMDFQVSDVKRPLAAVWRIAEKGNLVQFGPRREDNFIQNIDSGERTEIRRKGRSYVLDVELVRRKIDAVQSPFGGQA